MRIVKRGMDSVGINTKGSMAENRFLDKEHDWREKNEECEKGEERMWEQDH